MNVMIERRLWLWFPLLMVLGMVPDLRAEPGPRGDRPELGVKRTAEYDYDVPEPGSYELPRLMEAGDGVVLGAGGKPARLRGLMGGRITVLSFIYTRCPDPRACPMATGALRRLHAFTERDPAVGRELLLASMSFDPAFDTPKVMEAFGRANRREETGAPWRFLTAPSKSELDPILAAYGQVIDRRRDDPVKRIFHPVRVYLIDREGQVRNIYSLGLLDPRMVMTDIRTLLMEEEARRGEGKERAGFPDSRVGTLSRPGPTAP